MAEQLLAAYPQSPLLFWVAGSVLVYALVTNAAWLVNRTLTRRKRQLPAALGWLAELCALLFFVGVPYLALGGWPLPPFSGLLSPADLGMAAFGDDWPATRWLGSAGTGLALGLAGLAVLAAGWGLANRGSSRLVLPAQGGGTFLIRGLYREAHWSFYRAALAVTFADVYAGTWGGLTLVLFEWSLNPAWRQRWSDPERGGLAWLGIGLALLSTLLFLLTRNVWICVVVHWLVAATLGMVAHRPTVEPA